jgi:hypothetical protein
MLEVRGVLLVVLFDYLKRIQKENRSVKYLMRHFRKVCSKLTAGCAVVMKN